MHVTTAFDLTLANPLGRAFTGGLGGPGIAPHTGPDWRVGAGMDLAAGAGSPVVATFGGQVVAVAATGVTVREDRGRVLACHQGLADVPGHLDVGTSIAQGEPIGVLGQGHLHLALAEVVAGVAIPIDLYRTYLALGTTLEPSVVTFFQDGDVRPVPVGEDLLGPAPAADRRVDVGSLAGVQRALISLGFDPGLPTGVDDVRTQHALRGFQAASGLRPSGVLDTATRSALAATLGAAGITATVA